MLFDLDGTLYHQAPLRRRMLIELALAPLRERSPASALRVWRVIRRFRKTREDLRVQGDRVEDLVDLQYRRPAEQLGFDPAEVETIVERWMHRRPLPHLAGCVRAELPALLDGLEARGLHIGLFSDYPARAKLEAMGLAGRFDPVLAATDPEIHAFKPHPAGLLRAAEIWDLPPDTILYVGDRPEVDAAAAVAAGMLCAIIGGKHAAAESFAGDGPPSDYLHIERLTELLDVL